MKSPFTWASKAPQLVDRMNLFSQLGTTGTCLPAISKVVLMVALGRMLSLYCDWFQDTAS